jgi:hypothetical protein
MKAILKMYLNQKKSELDSAYISRATRVSKIYDILVKHYELLAIRNKKIREAMDADESIDNDGDNFEIDELCDISLSPTSKRLMEIRKIKEESKTLTPKIMYLKAK